MKRLILSAIFALATLGIASAQKYCVIDSEKVFKSLDEYNKAMSQLDELGKSYQTEVDNKYKSIESLYNNYMAQKNSLSTTARTSIEQQILQKEEEAQKFQQELFGEDGTLMKKRIELIKPIQEKVFGTIESYAKANGYDLVLDKASNASILYLNNAIDHTAQVIEALKK
ncbi:MAG: OmpH family outer membrane protein [Alistipes sp.]|nr:OmpH family outer membrane protein [Alistipes sp.]